MAKLRRKLSFISVLALVLTMLHTPAAAVSESARQAAETVLQLGQSSSLQYALVEGTQVTVSGSVGLADANVYGIGSVSKMYTAVAVMKLVESGLVSLDKPVMDYVPEFTMDDERCAQITVRMLLNHSSGLMGSTYRDGFLFDDPGTYAKDTLLDELATQSLKADPGAYSVYCNDGFTLAEILVEKVSGKDFTTFLHENIFKPLGLSSSFTPMDSFDTSLISKAYYGTNENALPRETLSIIGTGGIYASVTDLARFGITFYSDTVLSKSSRDAMAGAEYLNSVWPEDDVQSLSFGLGWDNVELFPFSSAGIQALAKGGDTLNYHASLVVLPEYDMAAAVVSSGGSSSYNQLLAERLLIDALAARGVTVDESVPSLPEAADAAIPETELAKAGLYASTVQSLNVSISGGGIMTISELPGMVFGYKDDGSYRDEDDTLMFKLVEAGDGNVYFYQKSYASIPGLPPLATSIYVAQLMPVNEVSDAEWSSWEKYSGSRFLMLNEKYSSQIYLLQPFISLPVERNDTGYFGGFTILDGTTMAPEVQVPGIGSRDYQILSLIERADGTYLQANGYLAVCEDDVADIYGGNAICTIQPSGYARWYSVGSAAGRQMTVSKPSGSNFYIYDANGLVVASSIFGDASAGLPESGYIVFVGSPDARFVISMS